MVRLALMIAAMAVSGCATVMDPSQSGKLVETANERKLADAIHDHPDILKDWTELNADPDALRQAREADAIVHGAPGQPPRLIVEAIERVRLNLRGHTPQSQAHMLIEADDCPGFNARMHGKGYITICNRVFRELKSEDELAFVVAHELAHVILGHRRLDNRSQIAASAGVVGGVLLAGQNDLQEELGNTGAALVGIAVAATTIEVTGRMSAHLARQQERAADLLAIDLMSTNYDPRAARNVLATMRRLNGDPLHNTSPTVWTLVSRYTNPLESVTGGDEVNFAVRHPDIEARIDAAEAYLQAHYPAGGLPQLIPLPWTEQWAARHPDQLPDPSAVEEVERYLDALRLAESATNDLAHAVNFQGESPADYRRYCESAGMKIRHAIARGADFDRDIRRKATAVAYYCQDEQLLFNPFVDILDEEQAGYLVYYDLATITSARNDERTFRMASENLVARSTPGELYQRTVDLGFELRRPSLARDAFRNCREVVGAPYDRRRDRLNEQIRANREAGLSTDTLRERASQIRDNKNSTIESQCTDYFERQQNAYANMLSDLPTQTAAQRHLSGSGYIATVSQLIEQIELQGIEPNEAELMVMENGRPTFQITPTISALRMRAGPGTNHRVVGSIPGGRKAAPLDRYDAGFVMIEYGGRQGWISADYIDTPQSPRAAGS